MDQRDKPTLSRVLLTIGITVGCLAIQILSDPLFQEDLPGTLLQQALFCALAILAAILLRKTDLFRAKLRYLKKGWPAGWFLMLVFFLLLFRNRKDLLAARLSITNILLNTGLMLMGAFGEEVLFRGLIQSTLHRFFGEDSLKQILWAVFLSGLLYGASYLIDGFQAGMGWHRTVLEATIMAFAGMYYGAIYYRTGKNIWFLMILHGLTITASRYVAQVGASPGNIGLPFLAWFALYFALTLLTLRPKRIEELQEEQIWEHMVEETDGAS